MRDKRHTGVVRCENTIHYFNSKKVFKRVTVLTICFSLLMLIIYMTKKEYFLLAWPGIFLAEKKVSCFPQDTITVQSNGRLGNQILEYASAWGVARGYGLKPFAPEDMIGRLKEVFESLSIPTANEFIGKEVSCWGNNDELKYEDVIGSLEKIDLNVSSLDAIVVMSKESGRIIVLEEYSILVEAIVPLAAELRQEFRYKTALVTGAQQVLATVGEWMVSGNKTSDLSRNQVIYVGVHVRRTDYKKHIRYLYEAKDEAGVHYYRRAVQWMRSSLSKDAGREVTVAFVVASDDPVWCQSVLIPSLIGPDQGSRVSDHLGHFGVFWGGQGDITTPEQDLVLLSSCNHSIFSYGTYGIWSALMAGGRTVVYNISGSEGNRHIKGYSPAMQFAQHMNNWVALW